MNWNSEAVLYEIVRTLEWLTVSLDTQKYLIVYVFRNYHDF